MKNYALNAASAERYALYKALVTALILYMTEVNALTATAALKCAHIKQ